MKIRLLALCVIFCAFGWHLDVHAQDLKFDNLVLVSGVDKQVGAVYRQTLAAPGIDATITIVDLTGGTTLHTFDNNGSGNIDAFQPTVTKSATLVEEYARFQFDFFLTGTSTPTNVVNAEVNAVDVDGCCGLYEYSVYHGADSYTLETPTLLTAYEVPEGVRFQGPYGGPTGIDYSRTDYIAKVKYNSTESFTIDIGSNGTSIWPDREASVYFKEITFSSPETTLTTGGQIDFDGVDDYAELPSSPIDGLNDFTISHWFKYEGPLLTGSQEVFIMGQKQFFEIYIAEWSPSQPQYQSIRTKVYKDGGVLSNGLGYKFNPLNWTNITATVSYNSGTDETTLQIFRNGHPGTIIDISNSVNTNSNPFRIGSINGSSSYQKYNGWMDEIKIFDRVLTPDQIQQMVYQEIKNEAGNVRGTLIDKDIEDLTTNQKIPWSNLVSYFPMTTISSGELKDISDSNNHADLYNITTLQPQTTPLPFESVSDGDWSNESTWLHGDVWDIEDLDADIAASQTPEPWSIVHIHDDVSTSENREALGMFIDSDKSLSTIGDIEIKNNWYLQLDGTIDLVDDSQLVQNENSDLVTSATGKILRRQEGNANYLWYNYWTSPVGALGATSLNDNNGASNNLNNTPFALNMLKDHNSNPITFTTAFNETGKISTRWLHTFKEGVTYFDWLQIDENTNINPGLGYTQKGTGVDSNPSPTITEQQYIFEGKPNNGTVKFSAVDTGGPGSDEGSTLTTTLIGNPYPSALDARQFITDNAGVIGGEIKIWEQWAGSSHFLSEYEGGYGIINSLTTVRAYQYPGIPIAGQTQTEGIKLPTFYLPVGQGFFVEVANDGDIEFNNGQRVFKQEDLGESVFYRSTNTDNTESSTEETAAETQILRLEFGVSSGASRSFVLGFTEDATDGYDYGLDGGLITNPPDDDMGSLLNGEQYIIQAFAPYTPDKEIDLVLHASGNFTYTLESTEISNFPEGQELFLKDLLTGQHYDLRSSEPYDFTSVAGSFTERFKVVFQDPSALATEDFATDNTLIYVNQSEDKLHVKQLRDQAKELSILNMLGQRIKAFKAIDNQALENGLNISDINSGVYLINILTENDRKIDKKVIIN